MKFLALDQCAWILLDHARNAPQNNEAHYLALCAVSELVARNELIVLITYSNIFETQKLFDSASRSHRALLMNSLSRGNFLAGPDLRRRHEFRSLLSQHFGVPSSNNSENWFVTKRFWEAASYFEVAVPVKMKRIADQAPEAVFYSYLVETQQENLEEALTRYHAGIDELLLALETRRKKLRGETESMRRKVLSAQMLLEHQNDIFQIVDQLGISDQDFKNAPVGFKRDLVRESATLLVERELTLVLEAENRFLTRNDLQDMSFFTSAIPYCDIVVGEQGFVDRCRQAKLDKHFSTVVTSDVSALPQLLQGIYSHR